MFAIQILGMPNAERDATLLGQLDSANFKYLRALGAPPIPGDLRASDFDIAILGRRKRRGEAGCRRAHYMAQARISCSGEKFGIVLEDDASLLDGRLISQVASFITKRSTPTIVILGSPGYPVIGPIELKSRALRFKKILLPYPTSMAYAVNELAARLVLGVDASNGLVGMSDWPPELLKKCSFYKVSEPVFGEMPEVMSVIQHEEVFPKFKKHLRIASAYRLFAQDVSFFWWGFLKILVARNLLLIFKSLSNSQRSFF